MKLDFVTFGFAVLVAQGCVSGNNGTGSGGEGGGSHTATGGQTGTGGKGGGGATASGGSSSVGGSTATGGSVGSGGTVGSGGGAASGGAIGSGGTAASGGSTSTGGSISTGGSTGTTGECKGVPIVPDAMGHVPTNSIGIFGNWFQYADKASTTQPTGGGFPNTGGKMCWKGSISAGGYGSMGFELNDVGGQHPYNFTKNKVTGFCFQLTGTLPPGGVRFAYGRVNDNNVFFTTITSPGAQVVPATAPPLAQAPGAKTETWDPDQVGLIFVQIVTSATAPTPFDFCLEGFTAMTQ